MVGKVVLWVLAFTLVSVGVWRLWIGLKKLDVAKFTKEIDILEQMRAKTIRHKKNIVKEKSNTSEEMVRGLDETIKNIDGKIEMYKNKGAESEGRGEIENIKATKQIALGAALFSLASILIGVSALIK